MHLGDSKAIHRDYARIRPEDITVLPRAFYAMNFIDRDDFIERRHELTAKVKAIYRAHKTEIQDYNNHLPKLILKERWRKSSRIDKLLDKIIDGM
jgi:hypothetical protein